MARPKVALAQAASRHAPPARTPASRLYEQQRAGTAIQAFTDVLGGRHALAAELLTSPDLTPSIRKVLTLVLDPRFDRVPLAKLCAQADCTPGQFFAAFRDATLAKATIHAMRLAAEKLPTITAALLRAAEDRTVVCLTCEGAKRITQKQKRGPDIERLCPACYGEGTQILAGDFDKQKFAFELTGVIKKGPTIAVDARQDNRSLTMQSGGGGSLAQLQQAVSPILFNRGLTLAPDPADGEADRPPDDAIVDVAVSAVDNDGDAGRS